ncbi:MAG: 7-cyano-7-deazaguanine synthase, partial [Nitrososphaerales archaeon]
VKVPFLKEAEETQHEGPPQTWPAAYVPTRNAIFYAIAASWAETLGAKYLIGGHNATDAETYPDATIGFVRAMNRVLGFSPLSKEIALVRIVVPLSKLDKVGTIKLGAVLELPFELTWSCYEDKERACGKCKACLLRLKSFNGASLRDPLDYERG